MKKLTCLLMALSLTTLSFAEAPDQGKSFEERKAHKLAKLDKMIQSLQEAKTCVNNAKDQAALKACRQERKGDRQAFRENQKDWKKNRQEKRQAKATQE